MATGQNAGQFSFSLLGPLEVRLRRRPCTPTAAKQRALLAVLVLRANDLVPNDQLIEAAWDGEPPDSGLSALQFHMCSLRKALADGRPVRPEAHFIQTRPGGYVANVKPDQVDVNRYGKLVAHGRAEMAAGRSEEARDLLDRALSLWRGPALADLRFSDVLARHAQRMERSRLLTLEQRIRLDLALGRQLQAIDELEALCAHEPAHEPFYGLLMIALCQSGLRTEALDVYRRARTYLVEALGIEPGYALRTAQRRILEGAELTLADYPSELDAGPVSSQAPAGTRRNRNRNSNTR